jgi:drug/metabolite transporter (DMT)-like permease
MNRSVLTALGAAALFGASTPFAKLLLGDVSPWVLAAVLYLGSGLGLAAWLATELMTLGVWLHLSERHEHMHAHEALVHSHPHYPDLHHRHTH